MVETVVYESRLAHAPWRGDDNVLLVRDAPDEHVRLLLPVAKQLIRDSRAEYKRIPVHNDSFCRGYTIQPLICYLLFKL